MTQPPSEGLLAPYRVLDLTDETGHLCAQLLADLGADVIKVEPPGGNPARHRGPYYHDIPDVNGSLEFWAYNLTKRSVTCDLTRPEGRDAFLTLAQTADFVIESFRPGYLDANGLGAEVIRAVKPSIIVTSITWFGQSGPYRDFEGSDIVAMALGGPMSLTVDSGRPPLRMGTPQAANIGGAEAAAASMIAHYSRQRTGKGQHIDVSIQHSAFWMIINTSARGDPSFANPARGAGNAPLQAQMTQVYECQDGYISFPMMGGAPAARSMHGLTSLLNKANMAPEWMVARDWAEWDFWALSRAGQAGVDELNEITGHINQYCRTQTLSQLTDDAMRLGILLAPVQSIPALYDDPQLAARQFWTPVEHKERGETISYPGSGFYNLPRPAPRRAPLLGEHNDEVWTGVLDADTLQTLRQIGVI